MSSVLSPFHPIAARKPHRPRELAMASVIVPASERFDSLLRLARSEARRPQNNERVLEIYRQAHRMAKAHGTREQVSLAAVGIGLTCLELGHVSEAREALVRAGRP